MLKDSVLQLSEVQDNIQQWKERLKKFLVGLDQMESVMKERVSKFDTV